jgi:hypothetical protein
MGEAKLGGASRTGYRSPLRSPLRFAALPTGSGFAGGGEAGRRKSHRLSPPAGLRSLPGVALLGEAKLGDASRTGYRPPQGSFFFEPSGERQPPQSPPLGCTPYREWLGWGG